LALSFAYRALWRLDDTVECVQAVLMVSRDISAKWAEGLALYHLGDVCRCDGRLEEALVYYRRALLIDGSLGRNWDGGFVLHRLGRAYCGLGVVEVVRQLWGSAWRVFDEIRDRQVVEAWRH